MELVRVRGSEWFGADSGSSSEYKGERRIIFKIEKALGRVDKGFMVSEMHHELGGPKTMFERA